LNDAVNNAVHRFTRRKVCAEWINENILLEKKHLRRLYEHKAIICKMAKNQEEEEGAQKFNNI
jgi:hypothetical protein